MLKYRWNFRWILFLLSLLDMLTILVLNPAKSWASVPEHPASIASSSSTVRSTTIAPTSEQYKASLFQGSNSVINRVKPVSQAHSPVPKRSPIPALISDSVGSQDNDPAQEQVNSVSQLSDGKKSPIPRPANPQPQNDDSASQVNSVSQLSDVKPTDWAFQALQSLVERYGVITGYPNQTFKGNRAMTRYEFAAGVNAALNRINELVATGTSDLVSKEDLETLQKLQNQFAAELATLRGRVDALEVQTANLQQHQFSTTTILVGEVETVVGGVLAGNNVITGKPAPRTTTFQNRIRLELNTSFTGTDQLRTQLSAGNITSLGGTRSGLFGTNDGKTSDNITYLPNQVVLSGIRYRFTPTNSTVVNVFAQSDGAFALGLTTPINPYFEGSAANSISRYGRRNMVYDYGDTGAGVALLQKFGKQFELGLEYTAINPNDPTPRNGLFSGRYVALGQLIYYSHSRDFRLGFTYANTYSPVGVAAGSTTGQNFGPAIGSNLANSNAGKAVVANLYGVEAFYKISPSIALNGWVGYSAHRYLKLGDGQVWDWAVGLAFPDLFEKGSLGGIFVGMEPKLTGLSKNVDLGAGLGRVDRDTSLHIEGFYQYQITDNIAITPGVIWITAPDFNARNPDSVVGWIRTTLRF